VLGLRPGRALWLFVFLSSSLPELLYRQSVVAARGDGNGAVVASADCPAIRVISESDASGTQPVDQAGGLGTLGDLHGAAVAGPAVVS
jgi:hypothetical protein